MCGVTTHIVTSVEATPYESADWFLEKKEADTRLLLCCKVAYEYAVNNKSMRVIADELGFPTRTTVLNILKRHIRHTLNSSNAEDLIETSKELKANEEDQLLETLPPV